VATQLDRGWSGVAAAFIERGAVNYLGSLWPIFDEGSRRVAEIFYRGVCRGETIGDALRDARQDAHGRHDLTWAAFVLFGCPRTRLRAARPSE
jgi:CHAT domain-containing protein